MTDVNLSGTTTIAIQFMTNTEKTGSMSNTDCLPSRLKDANLTLLQ